MSVLVVHSFGGVTRFCDSTLLGRVNKHRFAKCKETGVQIR